MTFFNEGVPPEARLRPGFVANEGLDWIDPTLVRAAGYLSGDLPKEERLALERQLDTDPAFFNEVMPIVDLVAMLREAQRTRYVADGASARIELDESLELNVGTRAVAIIVTPIGEVILKEGIYTIDWTDGPTAADGLHIHRQEPST